MTSSISMFSKAAIVALFSVTALASQAATTTSASSSGHSITTYRVTGTVQQVDLVKNQITLKQDSVTELGWPARVASYHVNSNQILKNISEGQQVRATFTAENRFDPVLRYIHVDKK